MEILEKDAYKFINRVKNSTASISITFCGPKCVKGLKNVLLPIKFEITTLRNVHFRF